MEHPYRMVLGAILTIVGGVGSIIALRSSAKVNKTICFFGVAFGLGVGLITA